MSDQCVRIGQIITNANRFSHISMITKKENFEDTKLIFKSRKQQRGKHHNDQKDKQRSKIHCTEN